MTIPDPPIDDLPFTAKIDIKGKNGKWVPKNAESTLFPKNWSLERIKEEVAFVYENTVNKGLSKLPRQPTDLLNKYRGASTCDFDLILEVDDASQIMNAYPKI